MIQAALRAGQPQPWMYESLGIAMELDGRPKNEIERAVMSACDFSSTPEQLILIARYLTKIGLDGRAVDVYRQAAKVTPLNHEVFALGLEAARRTGDLDDLRWATLGVLRHAWPKDQELVRLTASRIARATLQDLIDAGDPRCCG